MPRRAAIVNDQNLLLEYLTGEISAASLKPIFALTSRRAYCVFNNDDVFGTLRMFEMERAESSGHISVCRTLAEACEKVEIKPSLIIELWPEIWGLD